MSNLTNAQRWELAQRTIDAALQQTPGHPHATLGAIAFMLQEALFSDGAGIAEHVSQLSTAEIHDVLDEIRKMMP